MRRFGKLLGRLLLVLFALGLGAWAFAPKEPVDREISFDANGLPADLASLQGWLDQREFQYSDIRPDAAKRIVWAAAPGSKTPLSIVYLHGFSASATEIRPVPDEVAQALGANLFYTRLAGHGRDGKAMAEASAGDWVEDLAEAMAIGRALGDRVLVISTSTGSTLAAVGATDPALSQGLAGIVMVSPNFGLRSAAAKILDLPFARLWGPVVAGETRSFEPQNDLHASGWTTSYPTKALFPMSGLVRHAVGLDYAPVMTPALVVYAEEDKVIDPAAVKKVMENWGGPVAFAPRVMGPGDDPYAHVIAGAALSPGQTASTVALIVDWAKGL
jgi:alpha-beta hydrolase superfamily lysophospholipase